MAAQVQPMSTTNGHDPRALMVRSQGLTAVIPNMPTATAEDIERALTIGDLSKMPADVRIRYYLAACESAGLNALTRPFTPMKTQSGEVVLYANKEAAEQLRKLHRLSLRVLNRFTDADGLYTVTVEGTLPDGRQDEAQGIVDITGLKGMALANARMKAESKAKRRLTMAMIGLGFALVDDAYGVAVPMDPSGAFRGEDFETDAEALVSREVGKTAQEHIADLAGNPAPSPAPALHPSEEARLRLAALHAAHGHDADWFSRYLEKMCKRLRVAAGATLSDAQLDGLYAEAVQVYAKQAPGAAQVETSTPPQATDTQESPTGHHDAYNSQSAPQDTGAWRGMLAGLLEGLQDATLAREAQSILEDADASEEAGHAMILRVVSALDAQAEDVPF